MRGSGLAVVGTDTGVGKTAFSRGLLALARRKGLRLLPFKPVESGVGGPTPSDAQLLAEAAGTHLPASLYSLSAPIAPSRAALREGVVIDSARIIERARELADMGDGLVLETAGGLLSPWAPSLSAADVLRELALPAIVVAADVLGAQNHALLTTEALATRGILLGGVLLMGRGETDTAHENAASFRQLFRRDYLGRIPHLPNLDAAALADALEEHIGWETLWALFGNRGEGRRPEK